MSIPSFEPARRRRAAASLLCGLAVAIPAGDVAHAAGGAASDPIHLADTGVGGNVVQNAPTAPGVIGPTTPGTTVSGPPGSGTKVLESPTSKYAAIDALIPETAINIPRTANTVFRNMWGLKDMLAANGFAFGGLLGGGFDDQVSGLPRSSFGKQSYIGQRAEFDTSTSYVYLTYDIGRVLKHIGLPDGQLDAWACATAGSYHIYPRGIRMCAAYYDQPLFNKMFDFKIGIINEQYFGVGTFVGGGVASGSLGPAASIITSSGEAAAGEGAPAINLRYNGPYELYAESEFQRSASPGGYVPEGDAVNKSGLRIFEPAASYLVNGKEVHYGTSNIDYIEQVGYEHAATKTTNFTWIRLGGTYNDSEFAQFGLSGYKHESAFWGLIDKQIVKLYRGGRPDNGFYAGASYNWGNPRTSTYTAYYELRAYIKGPFLSRPFDQVALVANQTVASDNYLQTLVNTAAYQAKNGGGIHREINSITIAYSARLIHGLYLNAGFQYSPNPTITYTTSEGSPWVFRMTASAYF